MDIRKGLNNDILSTTLKIQKDFPELIKYLDEFPEFSTTDDSEKVSDKELKDYLESLNKLIETYSNGHNEKLLKNEK